VIVEDAGIHLKQACRSKRGIRQWMAAMTCHRSFRGSRSPMDLLGGQLLGQGHCAGVCPAVLTAAFGSQNRLKGCRFIPALTDNRRSRCPAMKLPALRVRIQSSLGRSAAVTFRAASLKDRKNLSFKCKSGRNGKRCSLLGQCEGRYEADQSDCYSGRGAPLNGQHIHFVILSGSHFGSEIVQKYYLFQAFAQQP